jgi:hypothetical protein
MNLDELFGGEWLAAPASARMQVVNVLRQHQRLGESSRELDDGFVRRVGLAMPDVRAPLAIPLPHEQRVASKRRLCRQLRRVEIPPVAIRPAKRGDAAFGGDSRASYDEETGAFQRHKEEGDRSTGKTEDRRKKKEARVSPRPTTRRRIQWRPSIAGVASPGILSANSGSVLYRPPRGWLTSRPNGAPLIHTSPRGPECHLTNRRTGDQKNSLLETGE